MQQNHLKWQNQFRWQVYFFAYIPFHLLYNKNILYAYNFVYFVGSGLRRKIKCMWKVQSKSENPQRSATVGKFHAYERSESPGYENWVRTKYSGFTVYRQNSCVCLCVNTLSAVCVSRRRPPTCLWPDGSPKFGIILRCSNRQSRDQVQSTANTLWSLFFKHG